ncbi:MAG: helix-turn-helix transcriptional regulator [Pelagimonas sp.]
MLNADTFSILQQALRARDMTYAELGQRLGLSEPTIKRIFSQRDCKLSRLLEICEVLEISLSDVVDRAGRSTDEPFVLPIATEQELAADPSLFNLFILLRDQIGETHLRRRYQLSDDQLFRMGMRLEALGLAEVQPGGRIRLLHEGALQLRPRGPLARHIAALNMRFLGQVIQSPPQDTSSFCTISRRMRPDSAKQISEEIEALRQHIAELARQDQLVFSDTDLTTFKFTSGWAAINYPDILEIKAEEAAPEPI